MPQDSHCPPEAIDHLGLTLVSSDRCEGITGDGVRPPLGQTLDTPPLQVRWRGKRITRVYLRLRWLVRVLVKVVYLFPLLLVAKLVLFLLNSWYGDLITVGFVGLLVLFFSLFAGLFLLYPMVGPPSRRKRNPVLELPGPGDLEQAATLAGYQLMEPTRARQLEGHCEPGAEQWESLRISGRIAGRAGLQHGQVVLRDCWVQHREQVVRLLVGSSFAVVRQGYAPVVVDLQQATQLVLAGRFEPGDATPQGLDAGALEPHQKWLEQHAPGLELSKLQGTRCCLTVGDEVELIGARYRPVPSMEQLLVRGRSLALDQAGGSPYRGDRLQRGLRMGSDQGHPLVICKRIR